nr:IS3 family transposase [Pleionea mediterranea]
MEQHRNNFSICWMCRRFGVSKSGFYYWEKHQRPKVSVADTVLLKAIKRYHRGRAKAYGSPRMYRLLRSKGVTCSRRRVARIMRENGILASVVGLYTFNPKRRERYQKVKNLLKLAPPAHQPNQQWVADFTYLKTRERRWVYLATIMDAFSRKIVGWSISHTRDFNFTFAALKMALSRRKITQNLIFHTDQGIEYAGLNFQRALKESGLTPSMSGKGRCLDNPTAESFFHTFKTESFYQKVFDNIKQIRREFVLYIDFYNKQRLHSSIGYLSPEDYETANV